MKRSKRVYHGAVTRETIEQMVYAWQEVFDYNESACAMIYTKLDLMWRLEQIMAESDLVEKAFGGRKGVEILDLDAMAVDDAGDLRRYFDKCKEINRYLILGGEKLLLHRSGDLLKAVDSLVRTSGKRIILFFDRDYSHPDYEGLWNGVKGLIQNQIVHPMYGEKDVGQFLHYLERKWGIKLIMAVKEEIIKECGGYLWLVKQGARYIRDGNKARSNWLWHEDMELKLRLIWQNLAESEKQVMKQVARGEVNFEGVHKHSLVYLVKMGWLKKRGRGWQISVPLLERYMGRIDEEKLDLRISGKGELMLNGVVVEPGFSDQEARVLKLLVKSKGKVVSRETLAQMVWGDSWEDKYSDWALDQLLLRVRRKLGRLGLASSRVGTKRGEGFWWE